MGLDIAFTAPLVRLPLAQRGVSHHAVSLARRRRPPTTMRSRGSRQLTARRFRELAEDAGDLWRRSGNAERAGMAAVALGAATVASTLVSMVVHAGAMLTFFILPLVFLPLAAFAAASFGTVLLAVLALGGAGSFVILTPIFAVGALARLAVEIAAVAALGALAFSVFGGFVRRGEARDSDGFRRGVDSMGRGGLDGAFEDFGDQLFRTFDAQLHRKDGAKRKSVARLGDWTVDDVVDELVKRGLGRYGAAFERERIDGSVLLSLSEGDVREEFQDMPLGDRVKLWGWISSLQKQYARRNE